MSPEEFKAWVMVPENMQRWQEWLERFPTTVKVPPEMAEAVQVFQEKRRVAVAVKRVVEKIAELQALMRRPAGSMLAEERMAQCHALLDEIADLALETPEPHRTQILKGFVPLREQIKAIRLPED